jgi:hypothetical protein
MGEKRLNLQNKETIPQTVKQRLTVNIWGEISSKGATPFAVVFQIN